MGLDGQPPLRIPRRARCIPGCPALHRALGRRAAQGSPADWSGVFPSGGAGRCRTALRWPVFWAVAGATLVVLATACWRGWGGRWLRLARFPDHTRTRIDLAGLALLALIAVRSRWLKPWLGLSAVVSLGYGLGYGVMVP